ncbi:hypothetical protein ACFX15_009136 [Malus domestica]
MWTNLRERFAINTRTSIVQFKIDLQNIKKGLESIDKYLQRIKDSRDQLAAVGVPISDKDIVIVALRDLPSDYNTIKAVIRGRESLVFIKILQSQLKAEEATLEKVTHPSPLMTTMYTHGSCYDHEDPSGSQTLPLLSGSGSRNVSGSTMSFALMAQMPNAVFQPSLGFQLLPLLYMTSPSLAFVSQNGSGSYNNF